jgi:uncharacterized ion transporter superfamily protein YfcC
MSNEGKESTGVLERKASKPFFQNLHVYVLLVGVLMLLTALTHIIPAGEFETYEDPVTERTLIVPGSYHPVDPSPVGFFQMVMSIQQGMIDASDIIFFIFFAYGFVNVLVESGTLFGAVGALLRHFKGVGALIIPSFMFLFGVLGSTVGIFEEVYGLIPAFMGIFLALGYDGLVGGAVVVVGVATGFAAATLNPFTIGVAQKIAELPFGSGWQFRIVIFLAFQLLAIFYVMRYAARVKSNPDLSVVKGVHFPMGEGVNETLIRDHPFTGRHQLSALCLVLTVLFVVVGTTQWGWYLDELAALFIVMMVVVGLINGYSLNRIAELFVEAVGRVALGALVVGVARSLTLVMTEGKIIHTVIYWASGVVADLSHSLAAVGMLVVQNLLNFFIPSGSGQAAASMPIMVPLADTLEIKRQVAVLAFQFGDGFSNMIWPTAVATECGLMGIPIQRWYRFMVPLFLLMFVLQVIFILVAVAINFGPV